MLNVLPFPDSPLGAHVFNWDFSQRLSDREVVEIKQQLAKHSVLVFRDHQSLDDDQLVAFAASFGPLIEGAAFFGESGSHPQILRVNNLRGKNGQALGTGGAEACDWHSDYSYLQSCGVISFLDAQIVPPVGGTTYFASTYTVFEHLDSEERKEISEFSCFHDTLAADRNIRVEEATEKQTHLGDKIVAKPSATHPMVMTHPDTGREALYVNPMLTRYVRGLSAEKSHEILERLFYMTTRGENIYAHQWQAGDLVMWDNIGIIHRRDGFDPHEKRSMRQLTTLMH